MSAIAGIDHTLIATADLEAARATWARLGFTCTPRGRHIGWGTANHCIMFPDDYVELLGIVDPSQFVNGLDTTLATRGEGLLGLAFAGDVDAAFTELGPGLVQPPKDLARILELPEGDVTPRFRLLHPTGPGTFPALPAFTTQHLTPELLRRPAWLDHANGARGLEGVTVVVEDPALLAEGYAARFGPSAVFQGRGRLDVRVGPHTLRFLAPERFAKRYPAIAPPAALPVPVVMTVLVADLGATAEALRSRGVPTLDVQGARLVVPPAEATGVVLEFAVS